MQGLGTTSNSIFAWAETYLSLWAFVWTILFSVIGNFLGVDILGTLDLILDKDLVFGAFTIFTHVSIYFKFFVKS